jgi:hypothetical protein
VDFPSGATKSSLTGGYSSLIIGRYFAVISRKFYRLFFERNSVRYNLGVNLRVAFMTNLVPIPQMIE